MGAVWAICRDPDTQTGLQMVGINAVVVTYPEEISQWVSAAEQANAGVLMIDKTLSPYVTSQGEKGAEATLRVVF